MAVTSTETRRRIKRIEEALIGTGTAAARVPGKTQPYRKAITSAANAGVVNQYTATTGRVILRRLTLRDDKAGGNADMTSIIARIVGRNDFLTLLSADFGEDETAGTGDVNWLMDESDVLALVFDGTGVTAHDAELLVVIEAVDNGAYLA